MEERDRVVWLHRSGGFGLPMAQMQTAVAAGADAELSRLLDVAGAGGAPAMDPWDDSLLPLDPMDREARIHAVGGWLRLMIETEQPVLDHMAWWWHGHLVSGLDKVRFARAMVEQIRLFRRDGLGNFPALLRSITLDPAMLLYLDLHTSTGSQPNENYARELLELFALGVGEYTEADVKAAATALTGWVLRRNGTVDFAPLLHDDDPQQFLGATGVHDLDTVLAAVTAHPAMPGFLARSLAEEVLGTVDPVVTGRIADAFAASGLDCRSCCEPRCRRAWTATPSRWCSRPCPGSPRPCGSARPSCGPRRMPVRWPSTCATPASCRCCRPTWPAGRAGRPGSGRVR